MLYWSKHGDGWKTPVPMEEDPLLDTEMLMSEFSDTLFSTLPSHPPVAWPNPREIGSPSPTPLPRPLAFSLTAPGQAPPEAQGRQQGEGGRPRGHLMALGTERVGPQALLPGQPSAVASPGEGGGRFGLSQPHVSGPSPGPGHGPATHCKEIRSSPGQGLPPAAVGCPVRCSGKSPQTKDRAGAGHLCRAVHGPPAVSLRMLGPPSWRALTLSLLSEAGQWP